MSADDKDALTWAGDDDRVQDGATPSNEKNTTPSPSGEKAETHTSSMNSVALIGFGVFAGVYLLYSVAWLITAVNNPREFMDALAQFMFQLGLWFAVAAPALWFTGVLLFVPRIAWVKSLLWLAAGALVLVPWPYIQWAG